VLIGGSFGAEGTAVLAAVPGPATPSFTPA
jgi:hypothetical protein